MSDLTKLTKAELIEKLENEEDHSFRLSDDLFEYIKALESHVKTITRLRLELQRKG